MFTPTFTVSLPIRKAAMIALTVSLLSLQPTNVGAATASDSMPGMIMPKTANHAAPAETFTVGEPGKRAKVDRTIAIKMNDMSFEPNSLHVRLNETVRFVVTNTSRVDHEFVLGDVASQIAHRKEMVEMAEKGEDMGGDHDPNAVGVKAAKTGELIWRFTRAGAYEFDCNIPGHFESGMTGAIEVYAK